MASRPDTGSESSLSTIALGPPRHPQDADSLGGQASTRSLYARSGPSISLSFVEHADRETELAQTYLEHVAPSFSRSCTHVEQTWPWQVYIPAQALVSSTIRHGLLTSAAFYLYFREQEESNVPDPNILELATSHVNAFIQQSRAQLHQLDPQQANANVAATRLLCVLALAFYRQERAHGENEEMSWTWVHLLRGVKIIHDSLLQSGQAMHPKILQDMTMRPPSAHSAESSRSSEVMLYISRTRSARFATLRFANSQGWLGLDDTNSNVLSTAIDKLSDITELVCAGRYASLFRIIISWIANLDTTVVQMMTDAHPGVLAIYTHWLMLLTLAEDLWWIGDMGRAGIRNVLHVTRGSANDLVPVLSWPREILLVK